MEYKIINNLVYACFQNYYFFLDTGGPTNNILLNKKFKDKIDLPFIILDNSEILELTDHFPKKVILFDGNSYWKNKIFEFNYKIKVVSLLIKFPKFIL